jgi:outer membrane protein
MQKKQAILFLLTFFLFLSSSQAQDTTALTLRQCVDTAIKNNLLVQQSETQMQTNRVSWQQAIYNLLPFINAQASEGKNFGRSLNPYTYQYLNQQINTGNYALNTNLTLFSGLQLQNAIKQNAYAYDASKMDWQQQKDNITLNVILAYVQILSNQDILEISRRQADVDSQQVARLDIQNRDGAIAPSTLYDLQGQYANDLVNIVNNVNILEASKLNLYQILNIPYKKKVQLERIPLDIQVTEYPAGSDSIYQTALNILPLVKAADLRVKSYEKALKAARGQYYPTLSFYGSVNTNYSDAATTNIPGANIIVPSTTDYVTVGGTDYYINSKQQSTTIQKISFGDQFKNNRYTQIGLQLTVPIVNYFRARNGVKLAKINLSNYENIAKATRNTLQQTVELAYQNMIAAYGQFKSYQDQVTAYQLSFRAAEAKFNSGAITAVDYVIAKNNVDKANISLTQARYNYIFRTKILDYYQGRLTW